MSICYEANQELSWSNRLGTADELPPVPQSVLEATRMERAGIYLRYLAEKEAAIADKGMSGSFFPNVPFGD